MTVLSQAEQLYGSKQLDVALTGQSRLCVGLKHKEVSAIMQKLKSKGGCKLIIHLVHKNQEIAVAVGEEPLPPYCSEGSKIGTSPHTCSLPLGGSVPTITAEESIVASGPRHCLHPVSLVFQLYLLLSTDP